MKSQNSKSTPTSPVICRDQEECTFLSCGISFLQKKLISTAMPVSGLPVAAEITLDALLHENTNFL